MFILFYFILFYFILFYFILFYFIFKNVKIEKWKNVSTGCEICVI
jgi:hypothetical protein